MSDYGGRLIRATEPTVSTTTASGIWTIEEALKYKQAGTWPVQVAADPNFKQTVLLLHGDGTNGAQNNTFLDSSTNNFTITRNGNTTQGTFSPFSVGAGEWSNYFDGTGDYLTVARNSSFFPVANEDFTFEAWVYLTATPGATGATIITAGEYGALSDFFFFIDSSRQLTFYFSTGALTCANTGTLVPINAWTHVAVSRSGTSSNNLKVFVNGVGQSFTTNNTTVGTGNYNLTIGADQNGDESNLTGYISNLRIVKGTAVYTSNFTPSTTPLTAITNTSLLTCQSNRFVDNSTNAFAITRNGDVRVTPFSPFAPTAEYDAGTNGGSGYFDGTGDYLTVASNSAFDLGTGNFTIECWFYYGANPPTGGGYDYLWGIGAGNTNGLGLYIQDGIPKIWNGGPSAVLTTTGSIIASTWYHIAVVRNSSTLTVYLNGSSIGSVSLTSNLTGGGSVGFNIARWINASDVNEFPGYISNFRIVKGTAVYTGAFTPPTLPISTSGSTSASAYPSTTNVDTTFSSSNTSLLCNFTNAGIFDNTGKNNLETVGNAQIDTTTKKFGTGSLEFDGTTDYIVQPTSDNYGYGTGDFTIEFWLRLNATTTQTIVSNLTAANSTNPHIYINTTIRYFTANADRITGASLSTGQWYHIALVRASGSTRLYIDGTQSGSTYTDSNNYGATAPLGIGTYWSSGSPLTTSTLNGFIDDLRITKGVARYTANFTPPAAAFPNL